MDLLVQAGFILAILAYGVVLSRFIPSKYHFPANIFASVVAVTAAVSAGLSYKDLGLSLKLFWPGLVVAVVASLILIISILALSRFKLTRRYFASSDSALRSSPSRMAYETAVRIPLSTALTEEILFRGVLLGILLSYNSTAFSLIVSSLVFGLWHIFPALNFTNKSYYLQLKSGTFISKVFHVGMNVLTTAVAGLLFAWLRLLSGSIIAPWLLHWTINSTALISSLFAAKKAKK